MTGDGFLAIAGKLAASKSADEATCRTAISRAYYGAFHLVKQYLQSLGARIGRDHGELQRCLLESGHVRAIEAGRQFVDLQRYRVKADYDLANLDIGRPRIAQQCVELASDIRTILQELDTETDQQHIKAGIEAYRRKIGRA